MRRERSRRIFLGDEPISERVQRRALTVSPLEKSEGVLQDEPQGFTLIELLIVVVIIGILAAIAIPKFANTKEKAYLASMKSDLRNLITAEERTLPTR